MNHLRLGVLFSLGAHLVLFAPATIFFPKRNDFSNSPHDYHLPMAVQLAHIAHTDPAPEKENLKIKVETTAPKMKPPQTSALQKARAASVEMPSSAKEFSEPLQSEIRNVAAAAKAPSPSAKAWNLPPVYPEESRRLGQEGKVIIEALLQADGKVTSARVMHSSGHLLLDNAALEAVRGWRMDAPGKNQFRLYIPVTFRLRD